MRPSIHGDVLHSRPSVVNYGGTIGTVVYYGGNDGMLHAVDGNRTGTTAGSELWSFVPQEFFGRLKRLRDDTPEIRFPNTPSTSSATPRDYFVDGPLTVYQKLDGAGAVAQVLLFVPMRRGGRFCIHSMGPTRCAEFLWRKTSAAISTLGQHGPTRAWACSRSIAVRCDHGRRLRHVARMQTRGCNDHGHAVLVFDAQDGALLKTLQTAKSVAAPVAVIDTDFDGYADRGYVVDMGANVYRVDFETAAGDGALANWTITKIAALADGSNTRKFFYEPDVVLTRRFAALMLGSGNRERPLLASTNDRFYTLFDYKQARVRDGGFIGWMLPFRRQAKRFNLNSSVPGCYYAIATSGEKVVTSSVFDRRL